MQSKPLKDGFSRREFCQILSAGTITAGITQVIAGSGSTQSTPLPEKPQTNISEALKEPKTPRSLPGRYPGKVVKAINSNALVNNKPDTRALDKMLAESMRELTSAETVSDAWRQFVSPDEIIGLKVNPVAGRMLSTSVELTQVVLNQLESAGIPRKNLLIWDRREFHLQEAGFNSLNFPGVKITGTEKKDENDSFYDASGKLYGEDMIDFNWYYFADCEMEYDKETIPYMINEGKYSYFSKIATQQVDKIINLPILKNAGSTVTLCLKNLAYGAISNTARLHSTLWSETCAQVPCFKPLRDKVVLNIVDGIRGCYDGGPGANPQFFTNYNTILVGTDPVAVDRIGYEIVLKKRIEKKIQQEESPRGRNFLNLAQEYGLGVADIENIDQRLMEIG